jgi:hypothetical protein
VRGATKSSLIFHERLYVPWWWYPAGAVIGAILAAQFRLAFHSLIQWIPFAVVIPLALLLTWRAGRGAVQIDDSELRVRGAHLPRDVIGAVIELDSRTVRLLAGRHGDPAAYVVLQAWIGPGVQVMVEDPDDPTPYWLFSTRHPERISQILRAGRAG